MSLRKKAQAPASVAAWSVSDLSALYAENRSSLIAQARRILRSDADAAEVVQDELKEGILNYFSCIGIAAKNSAGLSD